MRHVDDAERRARLAVRHALAPHHRALDVTDAARAVVALHGTDPATTVLSALARTVDPVTPADVESALYETRTLVRIMAMRRTVFVVPREHVGPCLAGAGDLVAQSQRAVLRKLLVEAGVTTEPEPWLARAEAAAIAAIGAAGEVTSAELAAADPLLGTRLVVGTGAYVSSPTVASRLLTVLGADGVVVRARPRGTWTSTQFRWSLLADWAPDLPPRPAPEDAAARLAEAWLHAHGPATPEDLQWWCGWTKTRTRAALARLDTVAVETDAGPALLLADDLEPVAAQDPWVALLPALDPSAMAWKHRDHVIGAHRRLVYDVNGNAGPTVWVDGGVVGGWAKRDDGEVVTRLLEDVGTETAAAIDAATEAMRSRLGEVRLKARARGWTPVERELRR